MHAVVPASFTVVLLLGGFVGNSSLYAQALPTATKAAEISVFGGYTPTAPDFGRFTFNSFTTGADFTLFPHWFVDPSVEARFNYAHASTVSEHSLLIGPRLQKDLMGDRLHPYVDFLLGSGTIGYHAAPYSSDPSTSGHEMSYGGGVDFDISHHLSLKFDFQQQALNMGTNKTFKPQGGDYTLTPHTFTFGVTYHFQFPGLKGRQDLR